MVRCRRSTSNRCCEGNRNVTVYLGVPVLKSGQPNVAPEGPAEHTRYYLVTQQTGR